ncbi:MAG TPA: hypothetical protein VJT73_13055, partial [Polyangiaceae bacterium]|nr:hypothetical protein [Polyangiaceae bacterium]
MTLQATIEELDQTLDAIEKVLKEEFAALSVLDPAGIEAAASKKTALDEKLRAFAGRLPDAPQIRASLKRLQSAAQANQALLIHARSCLKGAIEVASGGAAESISYARPLSEHAPVR